MRSSAVFGDLKSLLILFGILLFAVLFVSSLIAAVGMISLTFSGQHLEVAPLLAFVFGMLAFVFGAMFVGLLYQEVRFLRGKGPEPKGRFGSATNGGFRHGNPDRRGCTP